MRQKIDATNNHIIIMIATPLLLQLFSSISLFISSASGLNSDGTLLLSFKLSLLSHPPLNWNHADATPCAWTGVTCEPPNGPVVSLLLPNSRLLGSISNDLGNLQHLRALDLSNNSINGTLPTSLFNCSHLQTLSLSSNLLSGELPETISSMQSLRFLNLSDNGFVGKLPESLGSLKNLTGVSLKNNYFSGPVPGGFDSVEVLDLSSNLLNGTLPLDFGGGRLNYLNLSYNNLYGSVFPEFAENIPANAAVDLSFNKLTGQIPQTLSLSNQKTEYFAGNLDLCGKPLKKKCVVPSSHSTPPNISSLSPATAAIAAIPKTAGKSSNHGGLKVNPAKVAAFVAGDVTIMVLLALLFFYVYQFRKRKSTQNPTVKPKEIVAEESRPLSTVCSCFNGSETETETETEFDDEEEEKKCLVMVDGETELETEMLLKASAYVLGASGANIVYKAVVGGGGGVAFAVRRIGESRVKKMREFEKIVRVMGKFQHPNVVRVRGFYWSEDEKLVIYDYVSNGSLALAAYKNDGFSSCQLSFEVRLKIAKGIAKGLSYIHEKKHVHGNIKPSNILLTSEMDPLISDFGLQWLKSDQKHFVTNNPARKLGRKGSTSSFEETINSLDAHVVDLHGYTSPYHAPESQRTHKPNPKWDVYSFGIILLELLLGKTFTDSELSQQNTKSSIVNNESKILKIIDGFITADIDDRKDSIITCFKLAFSCVSLTPQKRPSMKEALQVLEKIS